MCVNDRARARTMKVMTYVFFIHAAEKPNKATQDARGQLLDNLDHDFGLSQKAVGAIMIASIHSVYT